MFIGVLAFIIALVLPNGLVFGAGFGVLELLGVFTAISLLAFGFACIFTAVAFALKTVDSLVAIINFIAFPVVFVSNAMFTIGSFPDWMRGIATWNPISKANESARLLIVNGPLNAAQVSTFGWDMLYLVVFAAVFTVLGYLVAHRALKTE
jgi:ABC-2 type transport system permease protein